MTEKTFSVGSIIGANDMEICLAICLVIAIIGIIVAYSATVVKEIKEEKKEFNNGFCPKCGNAFKLLFVDSYDGKRIYGCDKCDNSVFVFHKSVDLWREK